MTKAGEYGIRWDCADQVGDYQAGKGHKVIAKPPPNEEYQNHQYQCEQQKLLSRHGISEEFDLAMEKV